MVAAIEFMDCSQGGSIALAVNAGGPIFSGSDVAALPFPFAPLCGSASFLLAFREDFLLEVVLGLGGLVHCESLT